MKSKEVTKERERLFRLTLFSKRDLDLKSGVVSMWCRLLVVQDKLYFFFHGYGVAPGM